MLPDPFKLIPSNLMLDLSVVTQEEHDALPEVRLISTTPGKSIRVGTLLGAKATLTISHSESRENKGMVTDRCAVRLDVKKTSAEGVDTVAQATVTTSFPRSGFTSAELVSLVRHLTGTLLNDVNNVDGELTFGDSANTLTRVLAGEP